MTSIDKFIFVDNTYPVLNRFLMQFLGLAETSITSTSNIEQTLLIFVISIVLIFVCIVFMSSISTASQAEPVSQPVQIGKFPFNRTKDKDIDFYTDLETDCFPEVPITNHFQDMNIFGDN